MKVWGCDTSFQMFFRSRKLKIHCLFKDICTVRCESFGLSSLGDAQPLWDTPPFLMQENGKGSLAHFQTSIYKGKKGYLAWYTTDWRAIVVFNIIGWYGNQTLNLTSVSLLEVQIFWGLTWKLVLDIRFVGITWRLRSCWGVTWKLELGISWLGVH